MSKHNKPYHNYNNYSNNTNAKPAEAVVEEVVEETTPVTEEVEQVEVTEIAEETIEPIVEAEKVETASFTTGVVNCKLLRMREAANTDAEVICELPEGTEVQINEAESTAEFYKVTTSAGVEGFCMKKFITIK